MWYLTFSTISLRVYAMRFEHIDTLPNSSQIHFPFLPTNICALVFFNSSSLIWVHIYSWMYGFPLEHSYFTRGCTVKENWISLSKQLSIVNSFLASHWHLSPPFLFIMWLGFAWACVGFVHVITLHEFVCAAALSSNPLAALQSYFVNLTSCGSLS